MKYRLGDLIQLSDEKNNENKFKEKDVRGISNKKEFIETKANLYDVSLKPYLLVKPDYFSYVTITSRNGNKISIAHNTTNETYLVSSSYIVFYIKEPKILLSDYLFMLFNRAEFDRESRYNSWGSAREAFSWDDMCDIELNLPAVEIQRKYVDIYDSLLKNQQAFEKGTEDLKIVCDSYIENVRKKEGKRKLNALIHEVSEKNSEGLYKKEKGVSIEKKFIDTKAASRDITSQKIVYTNQFAFNSNTSRNSDTLSIAYNDKEPYIISNTYITFECNKNILLPEYLFMWFKRKEFDRFARYNSWGSARETIALDEIKEYEISIPTLEIQQDIVNIYEAYNKRKSIAEKLREQIKNICPVLIAGAIKEGEKANG